jgi:hypothetical protein
MEKMFLSPLKLLLMERTSARSPFSLVLQPIIILVAGMELSKNYIPEQAESKWYEHWLSKNYFKSVPDDRKPYTVVIPPPNVTGVLHMGHTLNETVQDILRP